MRLVTLDARTKLCGHGGDDALTHARGAWIGFSIESDAFVGNRQQQLVVVSGKLDVDRPGSVLKAKIRSVPNVERRKGCSKL